MIGEFDGYGPLFIQPIAGGPPRPLGVSAFDGAWMPDGKAILFAKDSEVSILNLDTKNVSHIAKVQSGFCWWPRSSPDGHKVRFTVSDAKTQGTTLWEVSIGSTQPHRLFSDVVDWSDGACGNWTADGRAFVFHAARYGSINLWLMGEPSILHSSVPVQLTQGPISFRGPLLDSDGRIIYVRALLSRGEIFKFNIATGEHTLLLPGTFADSASFSKDGQWITYFSTSPEYALWRSRIDGSERLRIVPPPLQSAFPQWSPDGKQIVVSTRSPSQPWKISLVSPVNGIIEQLNLIPSNALHPSWSQDGRNIVFGTIPTLEEHPDKVQIYRFDLTSRTVSALPGSKGLFSPAWSPDGRNIVARHADSLALAVFAI